MKRGRMQAKDIPDLTMLRAIHATLQPHGVAYVFDVAWLLGLPPDLPRGEQLKLTQAKARAMRKRGLIDGCMCGCRGDFELLAMGTAMLEVATT